MFLLFIILYLTGCVAAYLNIRATICIILKNRYKDHRFFIILSSLFSWMALFGSLLGLFFTCIKHSENE